MNEEEKEIIKNIIDNNKNIRQIRVLYTEIGCDITYEFH